MSFYGFLPLQKIPNFHLYLKKNKEPILKRRFSRPGNTTSFGVSRQSEKLKSELS
jgi:hypothetical protein